jgi:hypothetical protein
LSSSSGIPCRWKTMVAPSSPGDRDLLEAPSETRTTEQVAEENVCPQSMESRDVKLA